MSKETTKNKITNFRTLIANNSASPETVGVIMDEILELNPIQNNIVKVLEIPINLLSGFGTTEEQICAYVLALPQEERTILETDSKWNIVILSSLPKPPQISLAIEITSDNQIYLCGSTNHLLDSVAYLPPNSTGINLGDAVYSDPELTQVIPDGSYECTFGKIGIVNGVSTEYDCGR